MTTSKLLRGAGALDTVTGVAALAAAGWLGDQIDLSTTAVRVAAVLLVVIGVDTVWLAARPWMAKATVATEALAALLAVDLVLLGDPTGTGTALLLATAACCAVVAVEAALLDRPRTGSLVPA